MSYRLFGAVAALVVGVVLAVGAAEAKAETVKGTVSVAKDDAGKVTGVTLKAGDVTYTLAGDKVKDLEGLDKKVVEVTGKVEEKEGKKVLTVESFKEVKDAPATK